MNRAATLSRSEAHHKARAEHFLAEAQRILRTLALERQRMERKPVNRASVLEEVKAILGKR